MSVLVEQTLDVVLVLLQASLLPSAELQEQIELAETG